MDPNPFRRRAFRWPWRSTAAVREEVDEELRFHLDMRAEELSRRGVPVVEARRAAVARFGDLEATRRYCITEGTRHEDEVRRGIMLEEFLADVVVGFRRLWKARGVASVAVVTLALGIGASTAVFSLVNAALLRPLPYPDADRLVLCFEGIPGAGRSRMGVSPPDYLDFVRDRTSSESLAIFLSQDAELGGSEAAERVTVTRAAASLFPLLGVSPALGRVFTPDEDRPDAGVVVLGHPIWQRLFGGRPDVIGRAITLDRRPHVVVGVMPAGFQFPLKGLDISGRPGDVWVPFGMTDDERQSRGGYFRNGVIGRLRAGVSVDQARAEMPVLIARTQAGYPPQLRSVLESMAGGGLAGTVVPLREETVGDVRLPLLVLLAAVGLVLAVACANVANLLLSRAASRDREIAVMAALGAGRCRLYRMLLTESLILGLLGGAAGLAVAWAATSVAPLALPDRLSGLGAVTPDLRVLGFALLLSVATVVAFGLAPAAASTRTDLQRSLGAASRTTTGTRSRLVLQRGLAVVAMAFSTVLLVGAGLLGRSFASLLRVDVGSRTDHVLTATVTLPEAAYGSPGLVRAFERQLLERVRALPGVERASVSSDVPLASSDSLAFTPEHSPLNRAGGNLAASATWPHGDFFTVHGIPLKRGRLFTEHDRLGTERVVIVGESFAERVWPGENPLGKRMKWGIASSPNPWMTVVGMVGDVKEAALDREAGLHAYQPWEQESDEQLARPFFRTMTVSLRTSDDPRAAASPLRSAIGAIDPALAISTVRTMEEAVAAESAPQRMSAVLMAGFAGAALLMAVVGLYGIQAYGVAQRFREFGVRVALGARPRDIVAPVVRQGVALAAVGLAVGVVVALALARLAEGLLFRVAPHDPATFAAATLVTATVSWLAAYLPARRAARVDPIRALRVD